MLPQAKQLAKKLNEALDEMDAPEAIRERSVVFSKMLDIPKQDAWALLEGQQFPNNTLLQKIADELGVDTEWLLEKENDEESY